MNIAKELFDLQDAVCNELCKYRDTQDESVICDYMRQHEGKCPLDTLTKIVIAEKNKEKHQKIIRGYISGGRN